MNNQCPQPVQTVTSPDSQPNSPQLTLWNQLTSAQRLQLAQQLARLIRRLRDQVAQEQERPHV